MSELPSYGHQVIWNRSSGRAVRAIVSPSVFLCRRCAAPSRAGDRPLIGQRFVQMSKWRAFWPALLPRSLADRLAFLVA